ncbi:UNVERIFIED_CONTAM: hypothetical protein GTU68_029230 [Idotea baltica]|nr:hypothetical protein [Idotea baltica]
MRCPKCASDKSAVIDSRNTGSAIRRRRECQSCEFRYSTYERIEYILPVVLKKDGGKQPFSTHKLKSGLVKACEKRPVDSDKIDETVDNIERQIYELCLKEIPSERIGEFLMQSLKDLDHIAYIRFASVYKEFSDAKQFVEELEKL